MAKNGVKKAVIPVAGLGTRFLPITRAVPKEMLPIIDRPIIFHIIEEAVRSGIEDVILVTGEGKSAILDFFKRLPELEDALEKSGRKDVLDVLRTIQKMANIITTPQPKPMGLGHAVFCAKKTVGSEPFALLLGDELLVNNANPVTQQLINVFNEHGKSVTAVMDVPQTDVQKYGVIDKKDLSKDLFSVSRVVEKPLPSVAPSNLALPGRYVFTAKIFDHLEKIKPGKNGELQLTDGMTDLAQSEGLLACRFQAERYDTGDKFGYLQANIEFGLNHPEIGDKLKKYLNDLVETRLRERKGHK